MAGEGSKEEESRAATGSGVKSWGREGGGRRKLEAMAVQADATAQTLNGGMRPNAMGGFYGVQRRLVVIN
ncbi:hypothetical protein VCV18_008764 [Metarhizium anisopliae]